MNDEPPRLWPWRQHGVTVMVVTVGDGDTGTAAVGCCDLSVASKTTTRWWWLGLAVARTTACGGGGFDGNKTPQPLRAVVVMTRVPGRRRAAMVAAGGDHHCTWWWRLVFGGEDLTVQTVKVAIHGVGLAVCLGGRDNI